MKAKLILPALLFASLTASAQTLEETVGPKACECLQSKAPSSKAEVEQAVKDCIIAALAKDGFKDADKTGMNTVEGIKSSFGKVMNYISESCEVSARAENKEPDYKRSTSPAANRLYDKASDYDTAGKLEKAVAYYQKALEIDPDFVLALDNLGLAYRRLDKLDEAIQYYLRSLEVYPEGTFALQNLAVAYSLKNDLANSLLYYRRLMDLYPADAEGYFGTARILLLQEKFDESSSYAFKAYRIYDVEKSPYLGDCQKLLGMLYKQYEKDNRIADFVQIAKENNVEMKVN